MNSRPRWSYVQARLQARHGERLDEAGWHALEAARSVDQLIERARATPLRRFTERLNNRMSSHTIERLLRDAWRDYVAEIAAWLPADWRAAVLWTSHLALLPVIDALLKGATPIWANRDPAFAAFAEMDAARRTANLEQTPLAPLLAMPAQQQPIVARWYAHWRSLWPKRHSKAEPALLDLVAGVSAHIKRLDAAAPQDTSARYRGDLAQTVTRIFRRRSSSPAAVFCHLVLIALDLERLRGALVRRRLFAPGRAVEAA
jgi:hypothetical protein